MIPVQNSYWLSASLPNAVLMTYPDSGHGSLFQFHEFSRGKRRHSWPPTLDSRLTDPGRSAAFDSLVDRADIAKIRCCVACCFGSVRIAVEHIAVGVVRPLADGGDQLGGDALGQRVGDGGEERAQVAPAVFSSERRRRPGSTAAPRQ